MECDLNRIYNHALKEKIEILYDDIINGKHAQQHVNKV